MSRGRLALLIFAFGLLAFCFLPRPASADGGIWYVAQDGFDFNACDSPAAPCRSIQDPTLRANFQPGDTIRVAVGAYGLYCETDWCMNVKVNKSAYVSGGWNREFTAQVGMSSIGSEERTESTGFVAQAGQTVTLERFVVQNRVQRLYFYNDQGPLKSAGVYNAGTLTLRQCVVRDNIVEGAGAGIYNEGTLTIIDSAIVNNSAEHSYQYDNSDGGGIYNEGSLTIVNSTIAGNSANNDGGGIYNVNEGTVSISSSTLVENTAVHRGSAIYNDGKPIALKNSIVGNGYRAPTDCQGPVVSGGYNLFSNADFGSQWCGYTPGPGDQAGVTLKLGALGDYGGLTPTVPLLPGSPAINAGNPAGCNNDEGQLLLHDQRGAPRHMGVCDAGAFEASLWVTKSATGRMRPGDPAYFTLTLSNLSGDGLLFDTRLTDALPTDLQVVGSSISVSDGAAVVDANVVSWRGDVPRDRPVTISFAATINPALAPGAVITNTAEAKWGQATARGVARLVVASEFGTPTPTPPASCPFTPTPRPPFTGTLPQTGTAKVSIQHCADDAHEQLDTGDTFYGNDDVTTGGNPGGPTGLTQYTGGFMFRDVRVPQYAKITSATLNLFARYQSGVPVQQVIVGDNRGNSQDFTAYSLSPSNRPRTFAQVPWNLTAKYTGRLDSPDISAIVQEIVNRSDWKPGNDLSILIDPVPGANRYADWHATERRGGIEAELNVSYHGVSTQTPTPTPTMTPTATMTPSATPTLQGPRVFLPTLLR